MIYHSCLSEVRWAKGYCGDFAVERCCQNGSGIVGEEREYPSAASFDFQITLYFCSIFQMEKVVNLVKSVGEETERRWVITF